MDHRVVKFAYQWGEYEGQMNGDSQMHGKGIFKYNSNDNDIYDGDWKDNKRHGRGIRRWTDGAEYSGEWMDGDMHGIGKMKSIDGSVYDGE